MMIEDFTNLLSQPLNTQNVVELESKSIEVARGLIHARVALLRARGQSSAVTMSSEDKRRIQLDFDTNKELADVAWWENIQYILNRRIEILREGNHG